MYYPQSLHEQTCFQYLGYKTGDFPHSETACREVLALPIYAELSADMQVTVVRGIAQALGRLPLVESPAPHRPT